MTLVEVDTKIHRKILGPRATRDETNGEGEGMYPPDREDLHAHREALDCTRKRTMYRHEGVGSGMRQDETGSS